MDWEYYGIRDERLVVEGDISALMGLSQKGKVKWVSPKILLKKPSKPL